MWPSSGKKKDEWMKGWLVNRHRGYSLREIVASLSHQSLRSGGGFVSHRCHQLLKTINNQK